MGPNRRYQIGGTKLSCFGTSDVMMWGEWSVKCEVQSLSTFISIAPTFLLHIVHYIDLITFHHSFIFCPLSSPQVQPIHSPLTTLSTYLIGQGQRSDSELIIRPFKVDLCRFASFLNFPIIQNSATNIFVPLFIVWILPVIIIIGIGLSLSHGSESEPKLPLELTQKWVN